MNDSNLEINDVLQVVRFVFDGVEYALKIGEKSFDGVKKTAQLTIDILNKEKLMGKSTMKNMLKMSGGDIGYFEIPDNRVKEFEVLAKKYGVLWVGLKDLNKEDGKAQFLFPNNARPRLEQIMKEMGCGEVIDQDRYEESAKNQSGDKGSKEKTKGNQQANAHKKNPSNLNLKSIVSREKNEGDQKALEKILDQTKTNAEPVYIFGEKNGDYIVTERTTFEKDGIMVNGFSLKAFRSDGSLITSLDPAAVTDKSLNQFAGLVTIQNPIMVQASALNKEDVRFLIHGNLTSKQQQAYLQFLQADQKMKVAGKPQDMRDSWMNTLFHSSDKSEFREMILQGKNPNVEAIQYDRSFYQKSGKAPSVSHQNVKRTPIRERLKRIEVSQSKKLGKVPKQKTKIKLPKLRKG